MARGIAKSDKNKFIEGQMVVLTGVNMRDRTELVKVIKVGRVNVFVDWCGQQKPFRIDDGSEVGNYRHHSIYTQDDWG
jgi:hypothetical protein